MTKIVGKRPWDDEPTIEMAPEEPTLSAPVDVRAVLEAQGKPFPVPAVDRSLVDADAAEDRTWVNPITDCVATEGGPQEGEEKLQPGDETSPNIEERTLPVRVAPRAMPVQLAPPLEVADEPPYDVPGLAVQRRRMQKIVIGVLSFCALLCIGALIRQLWPSSKREETKTATTATAIGANVSSATASAAPERPVASATPAATPAETSSAASASALAAPVAAPVVTPTPLAVAAPAAVHPPSVAAPPAATAAAPRRPEVRGAAVRPRPTGPSGSPTAKPAARGNIVRDAPF